MEAERAGDDEGWNGVRRDTGVDVVDGVTGGLKDEDTRQDVSDGLVSGGTLWEVVVVTARRDEKSVHW